MTAALLLFVFVTIYVVAVYEPHPRWKQEHQRRRHRHRHRANRTAEMVEEYYMVPARLRKQTLSFIVLSKLELRAL